MDTFYTSKLKTTCLNPAFKWSCLLFFCIGLSYHANACNAYTNFSYSVTNKTVTFTNLSTGVNKYSWSFGDGGSSSAQSPVHTYSASNRYMVYLYAYDTTLSNCYDTTSFEVLIPGCSVHAGFGYSISGNDVSFSNSSTNYLGLSSKFSWDFGDANTSNSEHPVHTYGGTGPYTVMCVIYDTAYSNCSDTLYHTFSLDDCDVTIDFTYTFTGPKTIKVTNTSVHANYFNVTFDSNGEYIYTFPYPGTFQFSLFGRNTWCTGSNNNTDTTSKIIVVPGCHADARFSFGRDTNSTFAGILYDYSTFRAGATYKWHFGDGDSSSSMTPTHTYPGPGKYNLCLTIRDSICVSTYCDTIEYDSSGNMVGMTVPFSLQVIDAVLSVKETQVREDNISVYPNPGNGVFTIVKDIHPIRSVRVFDLQGKLITSEKFDDHKVSLDLSSLTNGVYMFVITDNTGITKVVKVMKL